MEDQANDIILDLDDYLNSKPTSLISPTKAEVRGIATMTHYSRKAFRG